MNKKKVLSLLIAMAMAAGLCACGTAAEPAAEEEAPAEEAAVAETVRVASLKGPTSIGMVKLMDDADESYEFTVYTAATEIVPLLLSGEVDIANIPANLAATLYAKSEGGIEVLNTNTMNVLYLLGTGEETSFEELQGRTIYSTGKGTTPEYTINHLIESAGYTTSDFTLEYKSEPTEVVAAIQSDPDAVAVLPQPFATVAMSQVEGLTIRMDFAEEWAKSDPESSIVTGVTVARKDFIEAYPGSVAAFMSALSDSIDYVNANPEEMSASVEAYDIVKAPVAQKAIPLCSLTYMDGAEMQAVLGGYLQVLYDADPAAVGGALPDDAFYYLP